MAEEKNTEKAPVVYTFAMIPTPARPEIQKEKESGPSSPAALGSLLWAVILLLAFWFITGGWETLGR